MTRRTIGTRQLAALGAALLTGTVLASCSSSSSPAVLLVGTYHGMAGQYTSIQAAVDAAQPGDYVLIAPGDYHETDDAHVTSAGLLSTGDHGGVVVRTSNLTIRGMNRDTVIVDGTKSDAPTACSSDPQYQNFGPVVGGKAQGRNGIVVWKADHVSIENLTVCNFLGGAGDSGNEIWWNGGDGSGKIGLTGYTGSYLTGTTSFFSNETSAAEYGIFSSNSQGPGSWNQIYGSNMNDSGMYVGACHQVCDVTIDHAWMENNALGYSGTNSGGAVVIENSQFDNNQDGVDTDTQIAGDPPPPQNGACPNGATSPVSHTHSCWVFIHNNVHDNNNGDTPEAGDAAAGPIGTGMTLSGGRNDTVMDNTFSNNGAWGVLFVPYPDSGTPSLHQKCADFGGFQTPGLGCVFEPEGDALKGNTFVNDGYFGNPSNADFGQIVLHSGLPVQLLRRQHGTTRERSGEPGAAAAHLRRHDHDDQRGHHAGGPGRVRRPPLLLPGRLELPGADGRAPPGAAPGAADHGQPVRRRALERMVPVGRVERIGVRDTGGPARRRRRRARPSDRRRGLPPFRRGRSDLSRHDSPRLERDGGVAPRRLGGPVRDRPARCAPRPLRARPRGARRPAGGRARWWARRGSRRVPGRAGRGRRRGAAARRRRARPRPRRRGCRARPAAWPPTRRGGRPAAPRRSRPRRRRAGRGRGWSAPCRRTSGRAGRPARRRHAVSCWERRSTSIPPSESVPPSSGQKRRSAVTRLDLPAPLDPVTATRPPGGSRRLTPSRARGRPGP